MKKCLLLFIVVACGWPGAAKAGSMSEPYRFTTFAGNADSGSTAPPIPASPCLLLSEGFNDITTLPGTGWVQINHSTTIGQTGWFQGNTTAFPSQSGAADSYIAANYNNTTNSDTISNWLLTPSLTLQNGAVLTFWTRTVDVPQFPDRLQVRLSTNGASVDVGTTATDVGDFTVLLLDINPTYTLTGYPSVWTQFTVPLNLPGGPVTGRIALRYFVENGGPVGANSFYIGIDTFQFNGVCASTPTPTPTPTATPGSSPVILSPLVANFTLGQPFTYQFETSGADSLDVSNLPPELAFDSFLSAITGTPIDTGTFQVGLIASNNFGTTFATLTITVQPIPPEGPFIASSTAATGRVGQPFNFQVYTRNGTPAAQASASGLPPGLSISLAGRISGTPTAPGSSAVNLIVRDGSFTISSILQLTFTINPIRPVIISGDTGFLTPGQPFSYTINAPGSPDPGDPTAFTLIGGLPAGLGFDSKDGVISGTYSPRPGGGGSGPDVVDLSGGLLGSVQLFGTNSQGTSTFQLLFLAAPAGLVNISTRLQIGTSANVLIGGFIITGNNPKVVIIRALGPSTGAPGAVQDPTLELHDTANHVITNDNWRDSQENLIMSTGIPPMDNREAAIVAALAPGNYTAIVAGKNGTTGIGLVEVYDLGTASVDPTGSSKLAQISTRGTVLTGDDVMIGGFIILGQANRVIVRGIGPSLAPSGIPDALADPTLELHDSIGSLIFSNDNWRSTQQQEIIDTGVPPTNDLESAIVATLAPGNYTAIVRGKGGTTGVALVEVYGLP